MHKLLLLLLWAGPDPIAVLNGRWEGSGEFRGGEAKATLEWAPALNDKFVRLDYRLTGKDFELTAVAMYKGGKGHWFDSFGASYEIEYTGSEKKVESKWGQSGVSVYTLREDGTLEVLDSFGGREFARIVYRRRR